MKPDYQNILEESRFSKLYKIIIKNKIVLIIILLFLLWEIIKGNIVFAITFGLSFIIAIVAFIFVITYYEKKNMQNKENNIIDFPLTKVPEKIIICDICECLIENTKQSFIISNQPKIVLCDKCILKHKNEKKT